MLSISDRSPPIKLGYRSERVPDSKISPKASHPGQGMVVGSLIYCTCLVGESVQLCPQTHYTSKTSYLLITIIYRLAVIWSNTALTLELASLKRSRNSSILLKGGESIIFALKPLGLALRVGRKLEEFRSGGLKYKSKQCFQLKRSVHVIK